MRVHPNWTDEAYWQRIAERAAMIARREAAKAELAARKREVIAENVERYLKLHRGGIG